MGNLERLETGRVKLTGGSETVDVRIETDSAVIDGRRVPFHARRSGSGIDAIEILGSVVPIRTVRTGNSVLVWAAGRVWRIQEAARHSARGEHGLDLLSPMPGRVLRVLTATGSRVERGQPILVLEAMKMEHVIRAAEAGRLLRVPFGEGDLVEAGALLAQIEE